MWPEREAALRSPQTERTQPRRETRSFTGFAVATKARAADEAAAMRTHGLPPSESEVASFVSSPAEPRGSQDPGGTATGSAKGISVPDQQPDRDLPGLRSRYGSGDLDAASTATRCRSNPEAASAADGIGGRMKRLRSGQDARQTLRQLWLPTGSAAIWIGFGRTRDQRERKRACPRTVRPSSRRLEGTPSRPFRTRNRRNGMPRPTRPWWT